MQTNLPLIFFNYARMWLWIDIAASFPIDVVVSDESGSSSKFNRLLRLLRGFKLMRMFRMARILRRLMQAPATRNNPIPRRTEMGDRPSSAAQQHKHFRFCGSGGPLSQLPFAEKKQLWLTVGCRLVSELAGQSGDAPAVQAVRCVGAVLALARVRRWVSNISRCSHEWALVVFGRR